MKDTPSSSHFPCQSCEVRDTAICAALDDEELRQLNTIVTSVKVEAGTTVFHEGDDSTYLFNLVSGALRLSKLLPDGRRQITGFLFPGDFLGLSIAEVYAYTAEALVETSLCRFERGRLAKLLERFPKLEHRLLSLAANELTQAQDHLMILGRKTAAERVATLLLTLSKRIGVEKNGGWEAELPMGRPDLADYTGLTTETVSRTITTLRKKGLLATSGTRNVHIPDVENFSLQTGDY
jgi:CRP/FNR family transcriptional regulator